VDKEFTARDLEVGYEETTTTRITLEENSITISGEGAIAEGSILTITKDGSYVIEGTLKEGQIIIDAEDEDKVQLVLHGAAITSSTSAPIYIKKADKVFITLAEGTENSLGDGAEYIQTDENELDGVIYSKSDLTLNGSGSLTISGNYKHGIVSKDELVITGGIYHITAVKDTLNGKDSVKIKAGTFTLSAATGNGIQSKNGEDTTKGYVYICGGVIDIVTSSEGIEGTAIIIDDGVISINATDDGFNAASGSATSEAETKEDASIARGPGGMNRGDAPAGGANPFENDTNCYIAISGGTITVNAQGDGLDSNGALYISGGTVYVNGPTENNNGSLDYVGTGEITGGVIVAVGSAGMAQGFGDTSTQYSLLYQLTSYAEANSEITLIDGEGTEIIRFTPNKQYQTVVISSPELTQGETYKLTCGIQTSTITLTDIVTSNGQTMGIGQRGRKR
jgi:hypothetical protein